MLLLFSLRTKAFSYSFVKLWLNRWCHMDYFTNVLAVSGPGNIAVALLSTEGQRDLIKNIIICVPKMNEGLTGLERHEGE